jgi:Tfp pilus assembly protein PilF
VSELCTRIAIVLRHRDPERALVRLEEAIDHWPSTRRAFCEAGAIYAAQGQIEFALRAWLYGTHLCSGNLRRLAECKLIGG